MPCDGGDAVCSEGEGMHMNIVVMMLIRLILLKKKKTEQSDWMAAVAGNFQLSINPCHHQCKEDPREGVDPSIPGWGLRRTESLSLGSLHTTFLFKLFIQLNSYLRPHLHPDTNSLRSAGCFAASVVPTGLRSLL